MKRDNRPRKRKSEVSAARRAAALARWNSIPPALRAAQLLPAQRKLAQLRGKVISNPTPQPADQ